MTVAQQTTENTAPRQRLAPARERIALTPTTSVDEDELVHLLRGETALLGHLRTDGHDLVFRANTGLRGGRAIDRRDDGDVAIPLGDLDPEALEFTLGVELDLLVELLRQVAGVWIQDVQHALERTLDQRVLIDLRYVVLLDEVKNIRQQGQLLVVGSGEALQVHQTQQENQRDHGADSRMGCTNQV